MINKFVISGTVNDKYEYTALYCGYDISRETYFFEHKPEKDSIVRFFSKGNELRLKNDGILHTGNGGTFCNYMFGINIPISDLISREVNNRLVLYGAYFNEKQRSISFTRETDANIPYEDIFLHGNSINNYFFFTSSRIQMDIIDTQKWTLKNAGRFLKTTELLRISDNNSNLLLADSFLKNLKNADLHLFILKLTDINANSYKKQLQYHLSEHKHLSRVDLKAIGDKYKSISEIQKKRIALDTIYRHDNNYKIIDAYKSLLIEAMKHTKLPQTAQNYIHRYRVLIQKKELPSEICQELEKKFPVKIEVRPTNNYVDEFQLVFSNLLFTEFAFRNELLEYDLKTLINAKHRAFIENNKTFERILIDVGKKLDEIKDDHLKLIQMDFFSKVINYFDRYDSCADTLTKIALGEEQNLNRSKILSLLNDLETFEKIEQGFFKKLFVSPVLNNRLLTRYGTSRINLLVFGLEEMMKGSKEEQAIINEIASLFEEEEIYTSILSLLREKIGFESLTSMSKDVKESLKREIVNPLVRKYANTRDKDGIGNIFNSALQDYILETMYYCETIPSMIMDNSWQIRSDFIKNSGLDPIRIEEIERIYCLRNNLKEDYIKRIAPEN